MSKCPEWLSIKWKGKICWINPKGKILQKKPLTEEDIQKYIEILREARIEPTNGYYTMLPVFPNILGITKEEVDNVPKQAKDAGPRDVRRSSPHKRKNGKKKSQSEDAEKKQGFARNIE